MFFINYATYAVGEKLLFRIVFKYQAKFGERRVQMLAIQKYLSRSQLEPQVEGRDY